MGSYNHRSRLRYPVELPVSVINTPKHKHNGQLFADDIIKFISLTEFLYFDSTFTEVCSWGQSDNKPALVQVMAWNRTGDKPLPEPIMTQAISPLPELMMTQIKDAYMCHHASMS